MARFVHYKSSSHIVRTTPPNPGNNLAAFTPIRDNGHITMSDCSMGNVNS